MTSRDTRDIRDPLRLAALASPDAPAIVHRDGILTYRELERRVSATARRLVDSGLERGSRVALYLPKDERYLMLLLAMLRAGIVTCPVSTRIPPQSVAPLLEKVSCSAVVTEDEKLSRSAGHVERLSPAALVDGAASFGVEDTELVVDLDQAATIIFSSGSTGAPKAARHTFGNHYYSALGSNANIPLTRGDRWLHSLPLYHVGGLSIIFRCLLSHAAIVLPDPADSLGESIERYGATHISLVATQLRRLLAEKKVSLEPLKAVLMGGGPIPEHLVEEAAARGVPIHTSYGLTEMSSQVTTTLSRATLDELRTSGRVLPHREISISDEGEILVRGETLFASYVENEEIVSPLDSDGWFHTRDLGELDESGYLRMKGRKDNLFISGGENVQPEEIEEALYSLAGLEEAVVVPVPDTEFGERPIAFVRTSNREVDPQSLKRELGTLLPRFKIPDSYHPWPEEAPTAMKPDRRLFQRYALDHLSNTSD